MNLKDKIFYIIIGFIWFLIISCLFTYEVKADVLDYRPSNIYKYYNNSFVELPIQKFNESAFGSKYSYGYAFDVTDSFDYIRYSYLGSNIKDNSLKYDISFYFTFNNDVLPFVSLNGYTCDVSYAIYNDFSNETQLYTKYAIADCKNVVPYSNGDLHMYFYAKGLLPKRVSVNERIYFFKHDESKVIEDAIKDQTDQQHKDSEAVKDAIEGDNLDTGSIESSKNDALDDYKNAEGNLNLDGADLSSIQLALKPIVASRVWSTIQTFLDTNAKLMQYVISMLSIGLIKLFLGR